MYTTGIENVTNIERMLNLLNNLTRETHKSSRCRYNVRWSWCIIMNARFTHALTSPQQSGRITSATTMWVGRVWSGRLSFSETLKPTSLLCWKVMRQSHFSVTMTWQCGLVSDCRCMSTMDHPLVTTLGGNCFVFVCYCTISVNTLTLCCGGFAGCGGLVVERPTAMQEDPGSNLTAAGRVYHDSHCDIQPWAQVVHPYCSA